MIGALLYLWRRGLANRLRRNIGRLRSPRYAVTLGVGLVLLWALAGHRRHPGAAAPSGIAHYREFLTAAGAAWAIGWTWIFGSARVALAFSPAEVAFLFPAPVSRRTLVQFKLIHAQGRILWNTLLWTVLLSPSSFGAHAWMRAISAWMLLSTLSLHRLGASFVRSSLSEHGASGVKRRIPSLVVLTLAAVLVVAVGVRDLPAISRAAHGGALALLAALDAASARPLAALLLLPFRAIVRPIVQHDAAGWVRAAWPALAILIAHYIWVVRSDSAFEEAAAEDALRRAARSADTGAGTARPEPGVDLSPPPFALGARGRPAVGIYWKNLTSVARSRRIRNVGGVFVILAAGIAFLSVRRIGPLPSMAGALAATWGALSLVMGPQWIRNDLRTDLGKLELLRSYPLRGAEIVAAEAAASATVLSLIQLMLIGFAYCATLGDPDLGLTLRTRTLVLAAAVLVLPAVNFMGLLLQNGAALLYPAWVRIGPGRAAGVEGLGQNMVAMLAYATALLLALVGPGAAGLGLWVALRPQVGEVASVPAGIALLAVLAAECLMLIRRLGRVFERIDIATAGVDPA